MFGGAGRYTDTQVIELSKYMYTVVETSVVLVQKMPFSYSYSF